ncbi:hypothetical protein, partial [Xenorhabdus bovienii]|uniref:hypothetical protein n=1 Tax=Xenorhabdus bovienii TaxID=40576 RepID=UPI0023B30208
MTQTDSREAPCGGCTGQRWRARQRATERSAVRAARSQCSGVGAGEIKPEAAGRHATPCPKIYRAKPCSMISPRKKNSVRAV